MGLKKLVVDALAYRPTAQGFTGGEARRWVREVYRRKTRNYGFTKKETRWAISHGFMPEQVRKLGINEENVGDYISEKDYAFLRPLNGTYQKWITDKITINQVFKPYRKFMPTVYYQFSKRLNDTIIIPLYDDNAGCTWSDVLELVREKEILQVSIANGTSASDIRYQDGKLLFENKEYTEEKLYDKLKKYEATLVIREKVETSGITDNGVLNLIIFNEEGDNPVIGDAYMIFDEYDRTPLTSISLKKADNLEEADNLDEKFRDIRAEAVDEKTGYFRGSKLPFWDEITETIYDMCRFVPQLEFFGAEVIINEDGFKIVRLMNHPDYPSCKPFSKETSAYLKKKVAQKKEAYRSGRIRRERGFSKIHSRVRRNFAKAFFPKDLIPYQSTRWISEIFKDFRNNKDASFGEKMWAYKRGFLSYRIKQYGITDENRDNYIADFEYRWLRHINMKYRKWMEDKITVKYICSDYNECFPEYYFHIICKNGNNKVISMMDLPDGYVNEFEEIFRLVEEKKVLALKPDEGSHGDGFYKFTCEETSEGYKYQLNYKDASKEQILGILKDINNQYLVTEYIQQCDEFNAINPGAVNTVRMLVYKKDGVHPEVGNAYIRIGSKKTGAVDNVGAGGMTAHIDVETGRYHGAKIAINNQIQDIFVHPDTQTPIDGIVPHWEEVKRDVLAVAYNIKQLEWFGFDLAVTNEGIKFPEINRFPDYPSVENYSEGTREYLLSKVKAKKKYYGYDVKPNNTLIHLPRRKTF